MAAPQGNMNGQGQRVPKFRRPWLANEEEILLACLRELVATGWKSDNGFRAGYINKLEDLMRVHFPTTNIRANPHIVSKLTAWKKNYGSLSGILSRSGVGFNLHGDYTIDCDAEQWEQIFNVDANAKNIRGKAWPLYEKWAEVFGKDRATGGNAEDVLEAVNDLINNDNLHRAENVQDEEPIILEDIPQAEETENSEATSNRFAVGPSRTQKRRKIAENLDKNLCDLLEKMHNDTNSRLESIAHRIGYQTDMGQARKEIWSMLDAIPNMGMGERYDVADLLIENPQKLEFFTGLPAPVAGTWIVFSMVTACR